MINGPKNGTDKRKKSVPGQQHKTQRSVDRYQIMWMNKFSILIELIAQIHLQAKALLILPREITARARAIELHTV